jgi:hypothetical protein
VPTNPRCTSTFTVMCSTTYIIIRDNRSATASSTLYLTFIVNGGGVCKINDNKMEHPLMIMVTHHTGRYCSLFSFLREVGTVVSFLQEKSLALRCG